MSLDPGARLGPYEIVAAIWAGGMGEVYRARDPRLGRDVAIKVISDGLSSDPERLQRFEQEARAAAALNHPNILAVFDIGHDASQPVRPARLSNLTTQLKAELYRLKREVRDDDQLANEQLPNGVDGMVRGK